MSATLTTRRFTVDEYYRMAETGILREGERVELIEGEIVRMAAIGSRHAACVDRLTSLFVRGIGDQFHVRVQNPVRLSDRTEFEPDLTVLRHRPDAYVSGGGGTSGSGDRRTPLRKGGAAGRPGHGNGPFRGPASRIPLSARATST